MDVAGNRGQFKVIGSRGMVLAVADDVLAEWRPHAVASRWMQGADSGSAVAWSSANRERSMFEERMSHRSDVLQELWSAGPPEGTLAAGMESSMFVTPNGGPVRGKSWIVIEGPLVSDAIAKALSVPLPECELAPNVLNEYGIRCLQALQQAVRVIAKIDGVPCQATTLLWAAMQGDMKWSSVLCITPAGSKPGLVPISLSALASGLASNHSEAVRAENAYRYSVDPGMQGKEPTLRAIAALAGIDGLSRLSPSSKLIQDARQAVAQERMPQGLEFSAGQDCRFNCSGHGSCALVSPK